MLVKEYRIPLPLSLEEYRIAQLFMIQKKSRLESTGSDSSVEIIENAPYENGPGGEGQYTKKIYHIGSHLPGWLKSLLPKTALRIEEEAWNAYPYTKTRYSCPFIDKFFIAIETHYLPDYGTTENVFKLSTSERKNTEIDLIDPVKDSFPDKDYKKDEDPHNFVSKRTGRGPLLDDWLEEYRCGAKDGFDVMCAYKLIQVEFKYWGMQSKIENFIQNGLRNPMLVGHRQAWSWQDEWFGLTIADIRRLEKEAQLELSKRMAELSGELSEANNNIDVDSPDNVDGEFITSPSTNVPDENRGEFHITSEEQQLGIHMKHIEQSESDDDFDEDAFFDALETLDDVSVHSMKEARRRSIKALEEENNEMLTNEQGNEETSPTDCHILIFVVQAGSISDLESDPDAQLKELKTFKEIIYAASNKYYPGSRKNMSIELVTCPSLSMQIMDQLKNIHYSSQSGGDAQREETSSFPFSLIPLLITQSIDFKDTAAEMTRNMNSAYSHFLKNPGIEEKNVEVFVLADCIGGLLVYHTLTLGDTETDEMSIFSEEHMEEMSNSGTPDFEFIVSGVFFLGSPIGLVAFNEMLASGKDATRPHCGQIYNLFHPFDPLCYRLEPIISKKFNNIEPLPVPKHQGFPFSFDLQTNLSMLEGAASESSVFSEDDDFSTISLDLDVKKHELNTVVSNETRKSAYIHLSFDSKWWGTKRIDYSLCCPQGLHQFPVSTLVHLCYNSYWESKDLVTFMLWQILNEKYSKSSPLCPSLFSEADTPTCPQVPCKWQKKRTSLKIKNMSSNHRANDAICVVGAQPVITGKFAYGPVAMVALTGEMVDVYMRRRPNLSEWKLLGTEVTDGNGRLVFTVPATDVEAGVYSVRIVVRGDHSSADCNMAIVPPKSEAVVFSIDSSFLSSISLSGINPKIRGGAVDAVRYWQELGYFIIYVSSRLLFQKYQVMSWLGEHNFPLGIVSFCDTVSANYQKHKMTFLKSITEIEDVTIHVAYGSSRDIPVYHSALNLPAQRIFLLGKKSKAKKLDSAQWITCGYAAHLNDLKTNQLSRRSNNNSILFSVGNFSVVPKKMSKKKKGASEDLTDVLEDDYDGKTKFVKALSVDGTRHLNFKHFTLKKTKSNNPP